MEKYLFETHYGKSTVTDTETGVIVEWVNGRFNETNAARLDPTSRLNTETDARRLAGELARACREIGEHVRKNFPELV